MLICFFLFGKFSLSVFEFLFENLYSLLIKSLPVTFVVRLDVLTKLSYLSKNTVNTFILIALFGVSIGSQNVRSLVFFLDEVPVMAFGWILGAWSELVQKLSLLVLLFANFYGVLNFFLLLGLPFGFFCLTLQIVFSTQLPFSFSVLIESFFYFSFYYSLGHTSKTFEQNEVFNIFNCLGIDATKFMCTLQPHWLLGFVVISLPDPSTLSNKIRNKSHLLHMFSVQVGKQPPSCVFLLLQGQSQPSFSSWLFHSS